MQIIKHYFKTVRINIQDALACPVISEVQLYKAPGLLA
jgi:alpha-L-fucosidase